MKYKFLVLCVLIIVLITSCKEEIKPKVEITPYCSKDAECAPKPACKLDCPSGPINICECINNECVQTQPIPDCE